MIFWAIVALGLLVCVWVFGDVELPAKIGLTLAYVASWLLLLGHPFVILPVHVVMCIIFGATAFGVDWLTQNL